MDFCVYHMTLIDGLDNRNSRLNGETRGLLPAKQGTESINLRDPDLISRD